MRSSNSSETFVYLVFFAIIGVNIAIMSMRVKRNKEEPKQETPGEKKQQGLDDYKQQGSEKP
jgi:hypothetical protein